MKKILLSLMLVGAFSIVQAQTVLNEVYTDPGTDRSEFIELYNSGAGAQNMDCFTILVYWQTDTDKGWYVIDLTDTIIASKAWFTVAADDPFDVQGKVNVDAGFSWNDQAYMTAHNGAFRSYQVNGAGTGYDAFTTPTVTDVLTQSDFSGSEQNLYIVLLFQNGSFINGFIGGGPNATLPAGVQSLPDLFVDVPGACSDFTADFSTLGAMEHVNQAAGNDNGYARKFDGKCGSWDKTAPGAGHTPNATNGSAEGEAGALTTAQSVTCTNPDIFPNASANFDISAISGEVTLADDFPVLMQVYRDVNLNDTLDGPDTLLGQKFIATVVATGDSILFPAQNEGEENVIFVYKTKRGCFDKVIAITQTCGTLPVSLKSFTAARSGANISLGNVTLIWETATEENNKGFYIQRKIGANDWRTVGFVPSQAVGGNSINVLRYEYIDNNPTKGITQYRLRQVDLDYKASYSNIRAVRGLTQRSNIIIYPNPSNDGKVNVVFEDVNVVRNVSLMDMSGRMLKQWRNVTNNNIQIDNLTPGFYSVRIENTETGELAVEKIVVNKR